MSSDAMRVRLHLRGGARVGGGGGLVGPFGGGGGGGVVVVAVPAIAGSSGRRVHDRRVKRVWDQPVSGRETVLLWQRRRSDNCSARATWRTIPSSRAR